MQDPARIHAARWEVIEEFEKHGEVRPNSVRLREPIVGEYVQILASATRVFQRTRQAVLEAEQQYDQDIRMRVETDGRVIDPSLPVRFSGAITEIAAIIDRTERDISGSLRHMEHLADSALFTGYSHYEEQARSALRNARKIAEIAELHPRTHLWLVWINESLSQASQIHHQMMENNRFGNYNSDVFTYVAHPPLIVATVGCTATIEEVGAFYLNKFTERSHEPDNTSSKEVLRDLKETYAYAEPEVIEEIIDTVVRARNDLSHYITRREGAIPVDNIERFIELCQECVRMTGTLVRELAELRLEQFDQEVLSS